MLQFAYAGGVIGRCGVLACNWDGSDAEVGVALPTTQRPPLRPGLETLRETTADHQSITLSTDTSGVHCGPPLHMPLGARVLLEGRGEREAWWIVLRVHEARCPST